jgi:peptidoglycan/LPS O-acetylase OafA/YrhL
MTHGLIPTGKTPRGALFRILCGSLTLGLSLVCVYASFSRAIEVTGRDAVTSWIFCAWGSAVAIGGVWLIRGRSKGKAIVFARDRKRLIVVALMAILVIGMLIYFASQSSMTDDEEWPFLLQTMFAVLFASVFFLLFDREDYREQARAKPLTAEGRRKAKRLLIIMVLIGALTFTTGIVADIQVDSWWSEGLYRLGTALLAAGAVLGFQLRKTR